MLRECSAQLGDIIAQLFQHLLDSSCVHTCTSAKEIAKVMWDFRPVALTSILSKCMERVVSDRLTAMVADRLDPLQFTYKGWGGECLPDPPGLLSSLHMDFIYGLFFFAFNIVNPNSLCSHLLVQVNPSLH